MNMLRLCFCVCTVIYLPLLFLAQVYYGLLVHPPPTTGWLAEAVPFLSWCQHVAVQLWLCASLNAQAGSKVHGITELVWALAW